MRDQILLTELKTARRSVGLSQRALAERIGVAAQSIKRLEAGVGSMAVLVAAMEALDFRLVGLPPGTTLGERLRAARCRRARSLKATAAAAGLSRTTVASLEAGVGSVASVLRVLAVLAPNLRRRALERTYWGEGDKVDRDSRFTPGDFLENVTEAFGEIDLDPCAHPLSPVVAHRRIMPEEGGDGLTDPWSGRLAYMNPPFSKLLAWLRRAHEQWRAGNVDTVVCLVPVRTDSAWFHEVLSADADIYLLRGRVRFLDATGRTQPTPLLADGADARSQRRAADALRPTCSRLLARACRLSRAQVSTFRTFEPYQTAAD